MPSRAGSAGTGTYIVFSQPAGVPGQSKAGCWLTGGRLGWCRRLGHMPPPLLQKLSCCLGPFPSSRAGSGSGWKMRPKAAPGAEGGRQGMELGT